jgi:threonine synthase
VLDEFFRTGIYRVRKSAETLHTTSPSMDISKASNFERFVFDLLDRDGSRVAALFRRVDQCSSFDLSGAKGSDGDEFKKIPGFGFASGKSVHTDRIATIKDLHARFGITVDTHTADGVKVAREHVKSGVPMIVLETALPAKFNETILEALGRDAERPKGFENIEALPQRFDVMDADVKAIKAFILNHAGQ